MIKVIKLKDETWERLRKFGKFEDTNDDVVRRLLDIVLVAEAKKVNGGGKK